LSRRLIIAGALLIAAGLLCWGTGLDDALHDLLRLPLASPLRVPILWLTMLGSLLVMGPLALMVVAALLVRRQPRAALWLFATVASGRLALEGLKLVVMRPRPPAADWLDPVASWSFPSSHSGGTMLTALALALMLNRRGGIAAAIGFALLIGWSRLALGVHWPGDVLAGWGFALLWVGGAARLRRI
jgi:undecaprenyl-diphosphatase